MDEELFRKDPRDFALSMVEDGLVDARDLLHACLVYMSTDEVRDMLDANELSPRFEEHDDWDEDDRQPDEAQEWYDYDPDC